MARPKREEPAFRYTVHLDGDIIHKIKVAAAQKSIFAGQYIKNLVLEDLENGSRDKNTREISSV